MQHRLINAVGIFIFCIFLFVTIDFVDASEEYSCIDDEWFPTCIEGISITANNTDYFGGHLPAYYAIANGIYPGDVFVNESGDTMYGDLNMSDDDFDTDWLNMSGNGNIYMTGNISGISAIVYNSPFTIENAPGNVRFRILGGGDTWMSGSLTSESIIRAWSDIESRSIIRAWSSGLRFVNLTATGNIYWTGAAYGQLGWGNLTDVPDTVSYGDIFVNETGDEMSGDLNMSDGTDYVNISTSGSINLTGNITMTDGWFRQRDYVIRPMTSNPSIPADLFALAFQHLGGFIPHVVFQAGAPGQASVIARSLILANDNHTILGTVNQTSCLNWAESENFELKVDCNSTAPDNLLGSGADLIIMGDLQAKGEIWLRDTDGEWHDFSDELRFIDALTKDTILTGINGSLGGTTFTISELDNKNISVNINETQQILNRTIDSITITEGTNSTPVLNQIFYRDTNDPRLEKRTTVSTIIPSAAVVLMGDSFMYASAAGASTGERFVGDVFTRFFNQGPLYVSDFNIDVTSTEINISIGSMMLLASTQNIISNHSTTDLSFEIHNDGTFHQHRNNVSEFDTYSTGEAIGNNKYFSMVCGIVSTHDNVGRLFCVVQNKPSSEYTKALDAELDSNFLVFFPTNDFVKKLYVPVVRVVMQRSGTTNTIQTLSSGLLYDDIRGDVVGTGGSAPTPVSDVWLDEVGDTGTGDYNFSDDSFNNNFVNISARGTITTTGDVEIGGDLAVNGDNIYADGDLMLGGGALRTTQLVVDSGGTRVGIGTASPSVIFHVAVSEGLLPLLDAGTSLLFQNNIADTRTAGIAIIGGEATGFSQIGFGDKDNDVIGLIRYCHQTNSIAISTNNGVALHIDSSHRVGIGTVAPTSALEVAGSVNVSENIAVTGAVTANTFTGELAWGNLSGVPAFVSSELWSGSGNYVYNTTTAGVGIGTASPDEILTLGDGTTTGNKAIHLEDHNDAYIWLESDEDNDGETDNAWVRMSQDNQAVDMVVGLVGDAGTDPLNIAYTGTIANSILLGGRTALENLHFGTNDIVRMTVDPTGQVGIGTTTPQADLDVRDEIRLGLIDSTSGVVRISGGTGTSPEDGSALYLYNPADRDDNTEYWTWYTGSTGDLRLFSEFSATIIQIDETTFDIGLMQNVGIGDAAPAAKLEIANWTGGSTLVVDTDMLVVNSSTGKVGIGTTTPLSTLTVDGSFACADPVIYTGAHSIDETECVVLGDASGGGFTLTLPLASGVVGRHYWIKPVSATAINSITVDGSGADNIDAAATIDLESVTECLHLVATSEAGNYAWAIIGAVCIN